MDELEAGMVVLNLTDGCFRGSQTVGSRPKAACVNRIFENYECKNSARDCGAAWPMIWWYNNSTLSHSVTIREWRLDECALSVSAQSEVHCVQNRSIFKAL